MHGGLIHGEITEQILGAAIEVQKRLGPGMVESTYESCLCHEMDLRGLQVARQVQMSPEFKGMRMAEAYRLDLLVESKVIVELKSVEALLPIHEAQLMTYLKLSSIKVGFLINFNVPILRDGVIRRIL